MSVFSLQANALAGSTSQQGVIKDVHIEIADPPTDSVSSISFSPQADFLAVGSWDNSVRIYFLDYLIFLSYFRLIFNFWTGKDLCDWRWRPVAEQGCSLPPRTCAECLLE